MMMPGCPLCTGTQVHRIGPYPDNGTRFLDIDGISACGRCGLAFAEPMPSEAAVARYYAADRYADGYQTGTDADGIFFQRLAASRVRRMFQYLPPGENRRCLDIGAGRAVFGRVLKEQAPRIRYEVVEPSPACRLEHGAWVDGSYASIDEIPGDDQYALITLNQVIEHLVDPVGVLERLGKMVAPGGIVFAEVPYRDDLYKADVTPHLTFWSPEAMRYMADRVGFRVLFCDSAGMPHGYARKYFHRSFSWPEKIKNRNFWKQSVNRILSRLPVSYRLDDTGMFAMDTYGGERQWLRCVMTPAQA